MRFCWNCGNQSEDYKVFCEKCGANLTAPPPQASAGQPPQVSAIPPRAPQQMIAQTRKSGSKNTLVYAATGVLVVALLIVGVLYGTGVGKLNNANANITTLTANVADLGTQLSAAQANAADLQTQLTASKANAADLQTQLTSAQSDLAASNAKVTSLTSDVATANAKVTSLTSDLEAANGKVTAVQTSLDKATTDLAVANATIGTQIAALKKVQDPQFFNTLADLTAWLAKDDTNINPAYAAYGSITKAYILQIKALRDGYLIGAYGSWDGSGLYYDNTTIAGGVIVDVNVLTDEAVIGPAYNAPLHPLPMP